MLVTDVHQEVGVGVGSDSILEELHRHLGHDGAVLVVVDDEQVTAQFSSLIDQRIGSVAFGVVLGRAHIAFAIHHLVAAPVEYGTTADAYLERFGIVEHHVGGHEAAVTPSVDADAVGIDIGQGLEVGDALHLVEGLDLAEVVPDSLFESKATVVRTASVDSEYHVSAIGHVAVPARQSPLEAVGDELCMGAVVEIDDDGIAPVGMLVVVAWLDETIIEVSHSISGLE